MLLDAEVETEIECEHVLAWMRRAVVGQNLWSAEFAPGVWLEAGDTFGFSDNDGTTERDALPLTVVVGAPASVYEITEGRWEIMQLVHAINAWLGQASADGDIAGSYSLSLHESDPAVGFVLRIRYSIAGSGTGGFLIRVPNNKVWKFLGELGNQTAGPNGITCEFAPLAVNVTDWVFSTKGVLSWIAATGLSAELTKEQGEFVSQSEDELPAVVTPTMLGFTDLAIVVINGADVGIVSRSVVVGDPAISSRFDRITMFKKFGETITFNAGGTLVSEVKYGEPMPRVAQVLMYSDTFGELLKKLLYSTGTANYNHPTYDVLPASVGLGIPGEILGPTFEASVDQLAGSGLGWLLVITKPRKLSALIWSDLQLRWAYFRWRSGHIELWSWPTPT